MDYINGFINLLILILLFIVLDNLYFIIEVLGC